MNWGGGVDGRIVLGAETQVHQNAEQGVDNHFEGLEADGADGNG